jgi:cytochrome P450
MSRRNDFVKPVELYGIVDIFGSSILSTEGAEWKRHRKIAAPAFNEKSNALVWKESLSQAGGLMKLWSSLKGNVSSDMRINDTALYTALLTLNVISGVGFGIRQVWDDKDEALLGTKVVPGFNTAKLRNNHSLGFKDALNTLLHGMIWMAIFPVWLLSMLKISTSSSHINSILELLPFELHKKLVQSYFECADYFKELSEHKVKQLASGEKEDTGIMDLMGISGNYQLY